MENQEAALTGFFIFVISSLFWNPRNTQHFPCQFWQKHQIILYHGLTKMGFSRLFPKFAILKTADFTTFHFEKHSDGVGYCGGCFGTENDEPNIENAAPFPAGIDTRTMLTYRSFTINHSGYRPVISGGSRPHVQHERVDAGRLTSPPKAWSIGGNKARLCRARESPQPTVIGS